MDDEILEKSPHLVDETMVTLEQECVANRLHSYGMKISVAPYIFHSPPISSNGNMMYYPYILEHELKSTAKWPHCELVIYPISPSISFPTTYPLLPASSEQYPNASQGKVLYNYIMLCYM